MSPARCGCGAPWSAVSLRAAGMKFRCVLCWLREYRPQVLERPVVEEGVRLG